MQRRHFITGLNAAQYLSYLLSGALYFSVFAKLGESVGGQLIGLGAAFVPLMLGGYVSGLSLIAPRVASVVAFVCAMPYVIVGVTGLRIAAHANTFFLIPSAIVIVISVAAFLWTDSSAWRRARKKTSRVAVGVFAILPAIFATWWLGSHLWGFLYAQRAR